MKQITFASSTMPRLHFIQQWFDLSDLAMEEAFHDTPLLSKDVKYCAPTSCVRRNNSCLSGNGVIRCIRQRCLLGLKAIFSGVKKSAQFGAKEAAEKATKEAAKKAAKDAAEGTEMTAISYGLKATENSATQVNVDMTQAKAMAMDNLTANGFSKTLSKDGTVTVMTKGKKTYTFYSKSTGTGMTGAESGVPSGSVSVKSEIITKIRFRGE